jgi:hypothetical protein
MNILELEGKHEDDAATLHKTLDISYPKAPILSYFYTIHAYPNFDLRYSSKNIVPPPRR